VIDGVHRPLKPERLQEKWGFSTKMAGWGHTRRLGADFYLRDRLAHARIAATAKGIVTPDRDNVQSDGPDVADATRSA